MNLKQRFSFLFSLIFSLILATVMFIVYTLFARFRIEEFKDRLEEKGQTTIKLLIEVREVDKKLLKIIDENTINKLYNEKIVLLDSDYHLIYSSIDDAPITWTKEELASVKKDGSTLRKNGAYDVCSMFYRSEGEDYYAVISADDKYGKSKLQYLQYLLLGAFLFSSSIVWFVSYYTSKKALAPLDRFREDILDITEKNLNKRLSQQHRHDEIGVLAYAFNQMLERINASYKRQKEFTSNASHELRTPVTRVVAQLENIVRDLTLSPAHVQKLKAIFEECYSLSDIISSLLLLSKVETNSKEKGFTTIRLDEAVFSAEEHLKKLYSDFKFRFEIENEGDLLNIEVPGDEMLLKIALVNLFKNAYNYSCDGIVRCIIKPNIKTIEMKIINMGEVPHIEDTSMLFNTFTRGKNVQNKAGSGLGLSIVKHILSYHNATIVFNTPDENTNELVITFHL